MSDTITYDSLWRMVVQGEIILPDGRKQGVLLRAIGRKDATDRRDFAREQSNHARLKLLNKESAEYASLLGWIETATDEALLKQARVWFGEALKGEAEEEIVLLEDDDSVAPPSTLTESLEREEDDRSKAATVAKERERYVEENIESRLEAVSGSREDLERLVRNTLTEAYILSVYRQAWDDATLYYGVLKPDGERFFGEMPANADRELLDTLRDMYRQVDEGSYRPSS